MTAEELYQWRLKLAVQTNNFLGELDRENLLLEEARAKTGESGEGCTELVQEIERLRRLREQVNQYLLSGTDPRHPHGVAHVLQ